MLGSLEIAHPVQRGNDLGHELGVLLEHSHDGLGIETRVLGKLAERTEIGEVLEHESDITERGSIVSHGGRLDRSRLRFLARVPSLPT